MHFNGRQNISKVDTSWIQTFSTIWESKVNDIKTKVDLNKLVAIFKICAIELSSVLKGYCQKNDGSLSRRIPLYSQLSILQEPILNAITKFVWKAREVKSQNSTNFLDMISDLSSVYLEHEILLTRHDLSSVRENQFYRVINQVESLFQNVFPESIEARLDTFLKCESLNNLVAEFICPVLRQILDKSRRMQNRGEHVTFATYVKFILLYSRLFKLYKQAKLDSDIVLEQARFLHCPVFSEQTTQFEKRLETLFRICREDFAKQWRKRNEIYIMNVKSVTKIYENLRSLPLSDRQEKVPTESIQHNNSNQNIIWR
ncbi:hypothetical protein M8J75_007338 [Diaphorina citri]|nr:hypothetical protein M8J75_007338 [Diaphorina citri]